MCSVRQTLRLESAEVAFAKILDDVQMAVSLPPPTIAKLLVVRSDPTLGDVHRGYLAGVLLGLRG